MLLIIYKEDTGQIVFDEWVNKNHSSGHLSSKAKRLLLHQRELSLRHIYIDDHISKNSHEVKQSETGISVVRREDTDPRTLEPLLSLVGELNRGEIEKTNLQIRYATPAAADPSNVKLQRGITLFIPTTARWHCASELFEAINKLDHPEDIPVNLTIYDNSGDESFGGLCRWFLSGVDGFSPEWMDLTQHNTSRMILLERLPKVE